MATTNAVKATNEAPQKPEANQYDPAKGNSSNFEATTSTVGDKSTVRGQMEGLLSEGSRYMDLAESKANEISNQRGLLNSTMAVGAAQKANIEAALPIAQQDASTFDTRERTNQGYLNQASQFNAGQDQEMEMANMQSENQAGQFNVSQANEMLQQQWSQESAQAHEETLTNLNSSLEQGIIDAKAYANLRGQYLDSFTSMVNEANINISEIQSNAQIPAAEKTKMIDQQIKMRDADLTAMKTLFENMPMWQQNWNAAA